MTVKVYIWNGKFTNHQRIRDAIWNPKADVGHAAMIIIDDNHLQDTIYISHRPGDDSLDTINNYKRGIPINKLKKIDFQEDCNLAKSQPNITLEISGLNEYRMRQLYNLYKLTIDDFKTKELYEEHQIKNKLIIADYHIQWSNCCTVVAYFIKEGLKCPYQSYCSFCSPLENISSERKIQHSLARLLPVAGAGLVGASFGPVAFILAVVAGRLVVAAVDTQLELHTADAVGGRDSGIEKFRDFWSIENLISFLKKIKDCRVYQCPNK
ncbi:hypothetical protein I8748_25890 [Nostoc sp. CENA67]|uniref:Uncharacterized protein n=1 Tax=Amazonocrinis nigriterrae CENA67 TaxID=2794033 RepID=A0A8J7HXR3_9NOST|nr:hypothetical protein [Amazonocrinis nigriterrae]MBH8565563.1 hypothetical protein [Amazonocrinis nigriterrae CENA67]